MSGPAERPIRRLLVANRGEIAARVFRACREMGVTSVAVYSDVDAGSAWSRKADESIRLPGVTATDTYLNMEALLRAAATSGADAVHPGYGFLSENAAFAEACAAAGLVFVGPSPHAMRVMGSKVAAREAARAAGVPIVPGADARGKTEEEVLAAAEKIGYPLLVKASAGGGGRGMRVVTSGPELPSALQSARAEARSAFGDEHVFLERYFERARHVEVQVLGDAHGNVVHLFERECSIQRRHQKIIEESPSPALDPATRSAMTQAAVALAREVDYTGAGTVEFLLDEAGRYYFLEMNARLQVEHPVTEMVTGVDVVVSQILVAMGRALPWEQSELRQHGHAIECRIYAEDPARAFAPAVGTIAYFRPPTGPGIRCDDGVATGSEITPHYDAMIAKVIAAGWDRDEAIRRMGQALSDTVILGVTTNVPYLQDILRHPAFIEGATYTTFLSEHMPDWQPVVEPTAEEWLALAAYESLSAAESVPDDSERQLASAWRDPWSVTEAWRNVR